MSNYFSGHTVALCCLADSFGFHCWISFSHLAEDKVPSGSVFNLSCILNILSPLFQEHVAYQEETYKAEFLLLLLSSSKIVISQLCASMHQLHCSFCVSKLTSKCGRKIYTPHPVFGVFGVLECRSVCAAHSERLFFVYPKFVWVPN